MSLAEISDLKRRVASMILPGTISQVDYVNALVKVVHGSIETAWLPWITGRAGGDRTWSAPEVGEQVILLSPSGDSRTGYVLPAIYQNTFPAPAAVVNVSETVYADGGVVSYDRNAHAYAISAPSGGTVTAIVGGNASVAVTGSQVTASVGENASATVTASQVTLAIGSTKIQVADGSITLTCGGTVLTLSSSGATLAAGTASGFENH